MAHVTALVLVLLISAGLGSAKQLRVMFVGNSFTYVNDLPAQIANIAKSLGDELVHERSVIGGCTLWEQQGELDTTTANLLKEDWDFIVLQDYSVLSTVANARTEYFHPAIKDFVSRKKKAKVVMYMTWGYHDGLTSSSCPSSDNGKCFPKGSLDSLTEPPCSSDDTYKNKVHDFACMGYSLARGYHSTLAEDGVDMVAPCGATWQVVRGVSSIEDKCKAAIDAEYNSTFPLDLPFKVDGGAATDVELYRPGHTNPGHDKHPTCAGQYINALTFYATLFGKSPIGAAGPLKESAAGWPSDWVQLTDEQMLAMQKAAAGVVAQCGSNCGLGTQIVV